MNEFVPGPVPAMARALVLLACLIVSCSARAQVPPPACYPDEDGCTRAYSTRFDGGACLRWYAPAGDGWETVGFCVRWEDIPADFASFKYLPKPEKDARWQDLITRALSLDEQAAFASLAATEPPSVYAVAAYRDATDRPTYAITDGVRKANGRIAVGEPCQCSLYQSGTYCAVKNDPNTVAVCAKR